MSYHLEGRLLEVCNCNVLCPCWIGEDPDFGTCDTIVSWRVDKGNIEGTDVGGLTIAAVAHIPGNILEGNWTAAIFVDDRASAAQEAALLKVYTGAAGGPVADLGEADRHGRLGGAGADPLRSRRRQGHAADRHRLLRRARTLSARWAARPP